MSRMWMVTGGTSGLGADIIRLLAAPVYRLGRRPAQRREDAIARDIECDCSAPESAVKRIETVLNKDGAILDVLVNCAAVNMIERTEDLPQQNIEEVLRVNVIFPLMLVSRLYIRGMLGKDALVINIGSNAAFDAGAFSAAYVVSKHALTGVTRSLARDYGDWLQIRQINFGKLAGTEMSDYIDRRQAILRGLSVYEERERQRKNWPSGHEIPLREAARFVVGVAEEAEFSVLENGGVINYGC